MSLSTTFENYSHAWWTPEPWLSWAARTLRTKKYFDPCPQNRPEGFDGLKVPWKRSWYANHPGSRGSTQVWWEKAESELQKGSRGIWCAFNCEQLRHMDPSPMSLPGWLVMPKERIGFIWGGPDMVKDKGKLVPWEEKFNDRVIMRHHGEAMNSPGNWTVFWSSVLPAATPIACDIIRTGPETWRRSNGL